MNLLSEELNLFHFVNIITVLEHSVKHYTAFNCYRCTVHFDTMKFIHQQMHFLLNLIKF